MSQQMPTQEQVQEQREKQAEMEEQKKEMLKKICTAEALDRIGRIQVVKPEKAMEIENTLLHMAMSGKLEAQITDEALKKMLAQEANQSTVQMKRRDIMDDDDW
eukprot:TRINITY_DN849_c0_g1_i2.p1 TRINITY_DN849_c0_g1~~TRINITY_DN849_c0_g1_i2.p1  ORF type:complete len:104 (-),score=46.42 TRINITY_DN849_c0_g1_i2:276-587(-)